MLTSRPCTRSKRKCATLDERVVVLRTEFQEREQGIRTARQALDGARGEVTTLEVSQARAASDMSHLAAACLEAVGLSLDQVVAAVAALEEAGELRRTGPADRAGPGRRRGEDEKDENEEQEDGESAEADEVPGEDEPRISDVNFSPDQVIAVLRKRIERLGPVNMMAIEQFDELESRHTFLTTQRKDLLELDRADRRGDPQDRQDDPRTLRRGVRDDQPELRAVRSRRCSAAGAPASS